MINYFGSQTIADRYARGRPHFHGHVIDRLKVLLGLFLPLERALDVGCGNGASTSVLHELAPEVVGIDPSWPMLRHASRGEAVDYVLGTGERLPFKEAIFDIITVSQAFHWMNRMLFLPEAARVLRTGAALVIYDNYFLWNAIKREDLVKWVIDVYRKRYRAPPRAPVDFGPGDVVGAGFRCVAKEEYSNSVTFTQEQLVEYLLTQTNVIAAVEEGSEPLAGAREWLKEETRPFFRGGSRSIPFGSPIWILQSQGGS